MPSSSVSRILDGSAGPEERDGVARREAMEARIALDLEVTPLELLSGDSEELAAELVARVTFRCVQSPRRGGHKMSEEKMRTEAKEIVAVATRILHPGRLNEISWWLRDEAARTSSFPGLRETYAMLRILSTEFQRAADLAWDARVGFRFRVT